MSDQPDQAEQPYPVYEKNGTTQIAASRRREIELRFSGWRLVEDTAGQSQLATGPAGEPTASGAPADATTGEDGGGEPRSGSRSGKRTAR